MSMALHHVNGDGQDNRLENLRFLCPNCHAQTPNYGGRGGHRKKRHLHAVPDESPDVLPQGEIDEEAV
jgi:5-methylcytosine-specific restriction endonuclease McrA